MTKDLQFHAIDLIQTVCSTSRDYAGQIFRRIVAAKQFFELDITYVVRGVRKMPLVSFHEAIKLLMVLPEICQESKQTMGAESSLKWYTHSLPGTLN